MKNVKRLYKISLRHWQYLLLGLCFMLGFSLFSAVSITFVKPVLDFIFVRTPGSVNSFSDLSSFLEAVRFSLKSLPPVTQWFSGGEVFKPFWQTMENILMTTEPFLLLMVVGGVAVSAILIKNVFYYGDKICFGKLKFLTIKDVRDRMFDSYMRQSLLFFSNNKVGDSMVRMVNDVDIISTLYITSLVEIVRNGITVLAFLALALSINAELLLISLVVLPLFPVIIGLIGKKIKKYSQRIQAKFSDLFSHVEEVLANVWIVKAFCKEEVEKKKFNDINSTHLKFELKSLIYKTINTPLSEVNSIFTIIIILLLGGAEVLDGTSSFSFGDFMVFLAAVASMLHPVKVMSKCYAELKKANVSLDRVSTILDLKTGVVEQKDAKVVTEFKQKIEIKNLCFAYAQGEVNVLDGVNLVVKKGQTVAFVGVSGSGKTTLVNLLPRFYDHTHGEILIDGVSSKEFSLASLRALFGIVTQSSILFTDTIYNNIAYGHPNKASEEEVKNAAKVAFADDFIEKFPNGYQQELTSKGANLSGGQKQRVCIARAVVADPPILIFDEATSALDTIAEKNVQTAIDRVTADRTVFVIAHRLSTVLSADKIVVMEQGRIVGLGKHNQLLKSCQQYKNLYNLQFKS